MRRDDAYAWMQQAMRLSKDLAHIGKFDVAQCEHLIDLADRELNKKPEKLYAADRYTQRFV